MKNNFPSKYSNKNIFFAKLFSVFLTFLYFFICPKILKALWPNLKSKYEQNFFYTITTLSSHTITFIVMNIFFWYIYTRKIPFFDQYRIEPEKKWPWDENNLEWRKTFKKTMYLLVLNHCVLSPFFVITDLILFGGPKCRFDLESFPDTKEIIFQNIIFLICEDFLFYWGHRTLHHKYFYSKIHKIHHEYINPISFCAEYAHPIEFFIGNTLPAVSGVILLGNRVHFATAFLWLAMRIIDTIDGHSGYEFPWLPSKLLPLGNTQAYHNFHHTNNVGNYGSTLQFWDNICGTNREFYKNLEKNDKKIN